MIDTIKVAIPLTEEQHAPIQKIAKENPKWQWAQVHTKHGEIRFLRCEGIVSTNSESYHRELRWSTDIVWTEKSKLLLEFSIPKYWQGHNILLLNSFMPALESLRSRLNELFGLDASTELPKCETWELLRLDLCCSWQMRSQRMAQQFLDSLKHLHYPRKRPAIYPTSIMMIGATYSLKFYLKLPEFQAHDGKQLTNLKADPRWIDYLEGLADGVLRFEVTLRRQWLKKNDLLTVADLLQPQFQIHWDTDLAASPGFIPEVAQMLCLQYWQFTNKVNLSQNLEQGIGTPLTNGARFEAPAAECYIEGTPYNHAGGGFTIKAVDRLKTLIQRFIDRFIGQQTEMMDANQVQTKLLEVYKPAKAGRLVAVWLYVQRFGTEQAKDVFGANSFYRSKRDLKQAGISLIEAEKLVTDIDDEFLKNFKLTVDSPYLTNHKDADPIQPYMPGFVRRLAG